MAKSIRAKIRRFTLWLLLAAIAWCCIVAAIIWRYGASDQAIKSDCIIVLGAAVVGSNPSPVFEERIRHGVHLYKIGLAPRLLLTGGLGDGQTHTESRVAASVACAEGVPHSALLLEEVSQTTHQNLAEAASIMRKEGLGSAIIVSDPLHMKRAMMMAADLGMKAVSSPTPTTRYRSIQNQLTFLVREIYFLHHYLVFGQ